MNYLESYKRNGFVHLTQVVNPDEVSEIKEEAKAVFRQMFIKNSIKERHSDDKSFAQALFELFKVSYQDFLGAARGAQHIISMHRFTISKQVSKLLGDMGIVQPLICVKPIIYFNSRYLAKIEGHFRTPAHQDWRSMQGSLNSLVVWIPLVDIPRDLGAIEFSPGSHLQGLAKSEKDEWYRRIPNSTIPETSFVPVEVKAGDLVVFSAFTVHRSGNNITKDIRWSIHVRYNDAADPTYIERGMPHPYTVYQPEQNILTENFPTVEQIKDIFS